VYEKVMGKGYYIIEDIDLTEDQFIELSSQFGKLWEEEDHWLAKETLPDNVLYWSSHEKFIRMSIPWHADNSASKGILHPDGTKWSDKEISDLFEDMINKVGVYEHKWKERQFLIMDNWSHLHYKQTTKILDKERLIWRRTVFQPWHTT
jgi:hypothetical protein